MRTGTIEGFSHVAVVTEDLEAFGEVVVFQPAVDTLSGNSTPMGAATAVDVVDSQKLVLGFAAALATTAVALKSQLSKSYRVGFYPLGRQLFMGLIPLLLAGALLFGMGQGVGAGAGKYLVSVLFIVAAIALGLARSLAPDTPGMQTVLASFVVMEVFERGRKLVSALGAALQLSPSFHHNHLLGDSLCSLNCSTGKE